MRKHYNSIVLFLLFIFSFGKSFAQCGSLLAPDIKDITKCQDNQNTVLTAKAKGSGKLQWFDGNNTTTATKLGSPSSSYTSTVTNDGNYSFYVAEYDNVNQCYGPVSLVGLTIKPKPHKPIIEEPYILSCANPENIKPLIAQYYYYVSNNSFQWYNFISKQPITNQEGIVSGVYGDTFTPNTILENSIMQYYVKQKDNVTYCISDSSVGTYHIAKSMIYKPLLLSDSIDLCFKKGMKKDFDILDQGNSLIWQLNNKKISEGPHYTYYPSGKGIDTFQIFQSYILTDVNVLESLSCPGPSLTFTQRVFGIPQVEIIGDSSVQVNSLGVKYTIKAEDPINDSINIRVSNNFWTKKTKVDYTVDWTKEGIDTIIVEELNVCRGYDTLIVKVGPYTYADFTTLSEIKVFPNPTKSNCTVSLGDNESETTIVLYDILGIVLQTKKTKDESVEFDLSGYASGIYSVSVSNKKGYWLGTVVKE